MLKRPHTALISHASKIMFKIVQVRLQHGLPRWLSVKRICLLMQELQETWVQSLGQEDVLEEEMAI